MRKQESLLAELHQEISSGAAISRAREEQLWEEQLDFALQTPGPQPDTAPQLDITHEEKECSKVDQEISKEEELTGHGGEAGQEGNTLPEAVEKVVEEGSQE